ncbi:hypothetical protein D3C75_571410 [compost metagenome]
MKLVHAVTFQAGMVFSAEHPLTMLSMLVTLAVSNVGRARSPRQPENMLDIFVTLVVTNNGTFSRE